MTTTITDSSINIVDGIATAYIGIKISEGSPSQDTYTVKEVQLTAPETDTLLGILNSKL